MTLIWSVLKILTLCFEIYASNIYRLTLQESMLTLLKTALFGCWKFFCFIHTSQVFESDVAITWDLNLIFDSFYSCTYCEKYSYWQKVDGFYHSEVECCYEEVNYWLFSENNVFMQNISVKQHLLSCCKEHSHTRV